MAESDRPSCPRCGAELTTPKSINDPFYGFAVCPNESTGCKFGQEGDNPWNPYEENPRPYWRDRPSDLPYTDPKEGAVMSAAEQFRHEWNAKMRASLRNMNVQRDDESLYDYMKRVAKEKRGG